MALFVTFTLIITAVGNTAVGNTADVFTLFRDQPFWLGGVYLIGALYKVCILILFFIFPNGRFVPGWARSVLFLSLGWVALNLLPSPYHPFDWPYFLGNVIDLGIYGIGLYAQYYRYHHSSSSEEKQQTKWILYGMALSFIGIYAYEFLFKYLSMRGSPELLLRYQIIGQPLRNLTLLMVPLTFSFSILRYRLYDIDILINRTLVYVPLTAILAGLYSASISLSQRLFIAFTGQKSDAAIVMTTLVLASLFTPLKNYLQAKVDKHFKEAPDPFKNLAAFRQKVRHRLFPVEMDEILREFLEEAVLAFTASSGAVLWGKGRTMVPRLSTLGWDGKTQVTVPLQSTEERTPLGTLALGTRKNNIGYSERERRALADTAREVALAIEQDRAHGVNGGKSRDKQTFEKRIIP